MMYRLSPIHGLCKRITGDERIRFMAVGAWNTIVGYLFFILMHCLAGERIGPNWTLVLSYCLALPHSFITQRLLVFGNTGPWLRQFPKFITANSVIFVSNLILLSLASTYLMANIALVQGVLVAFLTVASYLAHKHFSFASSP
jgi:putative flippase GtrA